MERPFPAYEGSEPYIFVCYSHDDAAEVYPEITRLKDVGFHLWYDEGIAPGSEWSEILAGRIKGCTVFLYLITPRSVLSEHCRREVNFALEQACGMLAIHLEPTDLPDGLTLTLSNRQGIFKYEHPKTTYEAKVTQALRDAEEDEFQASQAASTVQLGDWALDIGTQRLTRGEEEHVLDPKQLSVLVHLVDRAPEVVSVDGLLARTWPDVVVGDNVVHQVITHLRRAFGDDARNSTYIETLPKRGYRLLVPVDIAPLRSREVAASTDIRRHDHLAGRPVLLKTAGLVAALAAVGLYFWAAIKDPDAARSADDRIRFESIAVLPFIDSSVEQDLGALTDAVSRQLISRLDELPTLNVASLSAVAPLVEQDLPLADIGNTLGTPVILNGYVQRDGDQIETTVEFARASDGRVLWSETLLRDDDDRSLVVRFIAGELSQFVGRISTVSGRGPRSPDAYRAWLNWHYHRANFRNLEEVKWIQQVIQLEPDYSRAHLDAFESYFDIAMGGQGDRWIERANSALDAAEKSGLAGEERYRSGLGKYLTYLMGDLERGEVLLRETNDPLYAVLLMDSGVPGPAIKWFEFETSQQPTKGKWLGLGFAHGMNGDLSGALQAFEQGLRRAPDDPYLLLQHARAMAFLGRYVEAERSIRRLQSLGPLLAGGDLGLRMARHWVAGLMGDTDTALAGADAFANEGRHATAGLLLLEFGDSDASAQQFGLAAANLIPRDRMISSFLHPKPEWVKHPVVKPYIESLGYTAEWRREICTRAIDYASDLGVDLRCEAL